MEFSRQEYWNGLPFPSPEDLPDPGIEPGSPALQVDSLLTELWGNCYLQCCASFCYTMKWISWIYTNIPSLLTSHHPTPPLWVITEHAAGLAVLHSRFSLAVYFTYGTVCTSVPTSQFISPCFPLPWLCPQVCSLPLHFYYCWNAGIYSVNFSPPKLANTDLQMLNEDHCSWSGQTRFEKI